MKELLALHADILLRPLFYGVPEEEVFKYFKRSKPPSSKRNARGEEGSEEKETGEGEGKKKVPLLR